MNIAVRPPTPTEMKSYLRRLAFRRSIADKAAELKASKLRAAMPDPAPVVEAPVVEAPAETVASIAPAFCPHCACPLSCEPVPAGDYAFSIRDIKQAVSKEFGVTVADLSSPRRQACLVLARQIAMWLCKQLLPLRSYPQIGREFGNRDHTTVLHAVRVAPLKIAADENLAAAVARIRAELQRAP
jgi:hypothetical protein